MAFNTIITMLVGFRVPEKQNPHKSHERETMTVTKPPAESVSTRVSSQRASEMCMH